MKESDWALINHFEPHEFSDWKEMDLEFIKLLDDARRVADIPFTLTSTFREGDLGSAHGHGLAADIRCPEKGHAVERDKIVRAAMFVGFKRIGIYNKHVHLDILDRHMHIVKVHMRNFTTGMWWGVSRG